MVGRPALALPGDATPPLDDPGRHDWPAIALGGNARGAERRLSKSRTLVVLTAVEARRVKAHEAGQDRCLAFTLPQGARMAEPFAMVAAGGTPLARCRPLGTRLAPPELAESAPSRTR